MCGIEIRGQAIPLVYSLLITAYQFVIILSTSSSLLSSTGPETSRLSLCFSCASSAYLSLWNQLMHHYFPPKNFTDRCWEPDSEIGTVPCRGSCFIVVEEIYEHCKISNIFLLVCFAVHVNCCAAHLIEKSVFCSKIYDSKLPIVFRLCRRQLPLFFVFHLHHVNGPLLSSTWTTTIMLSDEEVVSTHAVMRGCMNRFLLFGLDEDVRDALTDKSECRTTDRRLLHLVALSPQTDLVYIFEFDCVASIKLLISGNQYNGDNVLMYGIAMQLCQYGLCLVNRSYFFMQRISSDVYVDFYYVIHSLMTFA
ncbi:BMA-HOT-4 [Dirofilaria immitis]|nr:BMA-HOT-4 [Dirofilaria immitis]